MLAGRATTLEGDAQRDLPIRETWTRVMQQVSATRSELLARRARIGLAGQGRDLLKERRIALVREFHRLGASVLNSLDALDRDAAAAGRLLGVAIAADGPEPLRSAALAAERDVEVRVRIRSVAGVPIVTIENADIARARTDRGYSLAATSARVDEVADRFESVLDRLLEVAALELSVRRLADEIARTTRRMNALEHVVLPELEAERAHIALILEQRELEDRVRLLRMRANTRRDGSRR
jgi:V/A-type H+-transporting ATPase subunit D